MAPKLSFSILFIMLVLGFNDTFLGVIDVLSNTLVKTFTFTSLDGLNLSFTPDSKKVIFSSAAEYTLVIVDLTDLNASPSIIEFINDFDPGKSVSSIDSQNLYVIGDTANYIVKIPFNTLVPEYVSGSESPSSVAVTPDGTKYS